MYFHQLSTDVVDMAQPMTGLVDDRPIQETLSGGGDHSFLNAVDPGS